MKSGNARRGFGSARPLSWQQSDRHLFSDNPPRSVARGRGVPGSERKIAFVSSASVQPGHLVVNPDGLTPVNVTNPLWQTPPCVFARWLEDRIHRQSHWEPRDLR